MGKATVRVVKIQRLLISALSVLVLTGSNLLFMPVQVSAVGEPTIGGGTNKTGETDSFVPLTGLTISGDSVDPIPMTLSVPRGQLSMTTTTGLSFSGDPVGSTLSFTGNKTDINAALASLQYRTTRAETVELTASIAPQGLVFFPGNGHLYQVVDNGAGISWDDAKVAAEGLTLNGATGYLATVTTQEENDYLVGRLSGDGWFGASDAGTEDDWKWVTGPETGTSFWAGLGDGAPVGGLFSNWAGGEPNNSGEEDCAQFYSDGSGWNDLPCDGPYLSYYIVEYGSDGVLPTEPSQTTFTITTTFPAANDVTIASCLDLIDVADNSDDHRYDNLLLSSDIDCTGETITPMFNSYDPDFGPLAYRGEFNGQGHTISNLEISNSFDYTGLIAQSDGATIKNISLAGTVVGSEQCIGSIVGYAVNTNIENVNSSMSLSSNESYAEYIGGLIGCYDASTGDASMTDSSFTGEIEGYAFLGGNVGRMEAYEDGDITFTDNLSTGVITAVNNGYNIGGLVGDIEVTDEGSSLLFSTNTSTGPNSPNEYSVGGIVGQAESDDEAVMNFSDNTVTTDIVGNGDVGGFFGSLYTYDSSHATVSNSHYTGDVTGTSGYIGGLIGEVGAEGNSEDTKFTLSNSTYSGNVEGSYGVGGLIGEIYDDYGVEDLSITNSSSAGTVTNTSSYTGGIAGYAEGLTILNVHSTSNIEGEGQVGGLIGEGQETSISESYASGSVTGTDSYIGGIIGRNNYESSVTESFATGNVQGEYNVGGLVGLNDEDASIFDSYSRGAVTGTESVGGVSGYCSYGLIENSYSTGQVDGDSDMGGLLGYQDSCEVNDSFWDTQTSAQTLSAATETGKTTAEMKEKETFTNTATLGLSTAWDFDTIWSLNDTINDGYPCLQWQAEGCGTIEDGDGISETVEDAAPNSGDANDDGTPDADQPFVASFVNPVTSTYQTVQVDSACDFTSVNSAAESTNTITDAGFSYPGGFLHFSASCGTPGYTTVVKLYNYETAKSGLVVRKFNPTTNAYFNVSGAVLSQATIDGKTVTIATYQVIDGGVLDTDGTANGVIVDPVGLGLSDVGAPNTGLGGTR